VDTLHHPISDTLFPIMRAFFLCAVGFALAHAISPIETAFEIDSTDNDGLSLLQVTASKHNQEESENTQPSRLCTTGLRSGRFCCGANCGRCGGRGCQNRPGGGRSCCTNVITRSGRRCNGANMQNCLLPRENGMGMGQSRNMGMGMGRGPEPPIPPTNLGSPDIVAELALCETSLQFNTVTHSNLGGNGPDGGSEDLIFADVAVNTNLVVTATSPYTPNMLNPTGGVLRNGAHLGFGVINMASGSTVDLTLSLVDSRDGSPKVLDDFVITFFDSDHGMGHESRESITVRGMSSFVVDPDTSLTIVDDGASDAALSDGAGIATFTSSLRGSKEDNPVSPLSLSVLQARRSLAVLLQGKSQFEITLSEEGYVNPQGRNIFFAGASNLVCDGEAKCSSYECPLGFELRQDAEFTICDSKPCSVTDHERCCAFSAPPPPPPVSTQNIAPAWR